MSNLFDDAEDGATMEKDVERDKWNTYIGARELMERPDGPIKEAIISKIRNNPEETRHVLASARYDENKDDVHIRVGFQRNESYSPFNKRPELFPEGINNPASQEVTDFRVSVAEAKEFFGTGPIKAARNLNKTVTRNIINNQEI